MSVIIQQLRAHGFDVRQASADRIYRLRSDGTYDAMTLRDALRLIRRSS